MKNKYSKWIEKILLLKPIYSKPGVLKSIAKDIVVIHKRDEILALLYDFSEELIGEDKTIGTGLPMLDEPNQYQNLLRQSQRKLRDSLLEREK